jgi:hypothetical protein
VSAEDAARVAELAQQLSNEMAELAKLRAGCSDLQKKAAGLQVRVVLAGRGRVVLACACSRGCCRAGPSPCQTPAP